jgi:hypothetical protein
LAIAGWQSAGLAPAAPPKAGRTSKKGQKAYLAIAGWQSAWSAPDLKAGKHIETVKIQLWQLPLDKTLLTPDNGSVSRFSRLS